MTNEAMNVTERNLKLKEGLGKLYTAQMLAVVAVVLMFIPIINLIALLLALGGAILSLMGIVKLRDVHQDYENAFMMMMIGFVIAVVETIAGDGILGTLLDVVSSVVSYAQVYFIIRATNSFLEELGNQELVAKGNKAWSINLFTAIMGIVLTLVLAAVRANGLGLILVATIAILGVAIWGLVVYIGYLGKAKDCF